MLLSNKATAWRLNTLSSVEFWLRSMAWYIIEPWEWRCLSLGSSSYSWSQSKTPAGVFEVSENTFKVVVHLNVSHFTSRRWNPNCLSMEMVGTKPTSRWYDNKDVLFETTKHGNTGDAMFEDWSPCPCHTQNSWTGSPVEMILQKTGHRHVVSCGGISGEHTDIKLCSERGDVIWKCSSVLTSQRRPMSDASLPCQIESHSSKPWRL